MNHINRWLYLGLGLLLLVNSLAGEDFFRVKQEIEEQAWTKKSIFYISPSLIFSNLGFHSNIYSYDYLESPDWTADIGLDLNVAAIIKDRFIFKVKEFPSYSLYLENERDRTFDNIFEFSVYTWVGRFNLNYKFERPYIHSRMNPEIGQRLLRWESRHTLSLDYGSHNHFYLNFYLHSRKVYYKDELYLDSFNMNQLFARTEYWVGISANKVIFTQSRLTFQLEYFDYRFLYIPRRDQTGGQFFFQVNFPVISGITGSFRYGVRFFRPVSAFYRSFIKPFGRGLIGIRLLERLRLHLVYLIDHRYSFVGADVYYDTQSIGGGASYFLIQGIELSYFYRLGQRLYRSLSHSDAFRRDDFTQSNLTLRLQVTGKMEIGLEYTAYRSDSTQWRFRRSYDYMGGYVKYDF